MLGLAFLLCLIASLVLLDKWSFGEFGLSQPIVSCPLLGLLFGDFSAGMFLGIALQLVWVDALPLGAAKPLDYQSAGVVGITSYIFARRLLEAVPAGPNAGTPEAWLAVRSQVLFASMVLAALATIVGQYTDDRVKRINDHVYLLGMRARRPAGVFAAHFLGFLSAFVRGMLVTGFFLLALFLIRPYLHALPVFTLEQLLFCPLAIGIAGLFKFFYRARRLPWFALGAVLAALLWVFWR